MTQEHIPIWVFHKTDHVLCVSFFCDFLLQSPFLMVTCAGLGTVDKTWLISLKVTAFKEQTLKWDITQCQRRREGAPQVLSFYGSVCLLPDARLGALEDRTQTQTHRHTDTFLFRSYKPVEAAIQCRGHYNTDNIYEEQPLLI
jgi:hypothetical protein